MKLKVKNLHWFAGRPIVILNQKTAKKHNIFVGDRILIKSNKKVYAAVDLSTRLVKKNEIGLSEELIKALKIEGHEKVEIGQSELSDSHFIIKKKMDGHPLKQKEIFHLINEIVHNNLSEAEIAYFIAAESLIGMSFDETVNLTRAMIDTGAKLHFKGRYIADKHCIGGVAGNRTTPIIVAICACVGLTLPKTSSRAITSASGTADVIETISNVEMPLNKIKQVVEKTGACLAWGGSLGLAPSDDKIIRVERLLSLDIESQLLASIISKKESAGSKYILIDIPFGKGSKIETLSKAKSLGRKFEKISKKFYLKIKVVYSKGDLPIGNGFGPVLEMMDVLAVLKNSPQAPEDLKNKSIYLASELMKLCGMKDTLRKSQEILLSGNAYEKFKQIINAQNGKDNFNQKVDSLRVAKFKQIIKAKKSGNMVEVSNSGINSLCRILGTPEAISAGVVMERKSGPIAKGEPLLTIYSESKSKLKDAKNYLEDFFPIKIK